MELEALYKIFKSHPCVATDSRKVEPGCLFFALKGANFDGNQFAGQAIEKGAAYAIVDNEDYADGDRLILVEDVLKTLQDLAHHHRIQFEIPLIAITGSNGKTTTKELVSNVLSSQYPTHYTKGNFNNHIGVPLTLLAMPEDTEVAVIEMGANHVGEIGFLCQIAAPTHGLITNIGKAHLEGFGGVEGIKKGKGELYRYLENHTGVIFLNKDEPHLEEMAGENVAIVYYKESSQPKMDEIDYEVKLIRGQPFIEVGFLTIEGDLLSVKTQLTGSYNFNNIKTAVALGKYFRVPVEKIKNAIEAYLPQNNRSQLISIDSNTFLMDAYNANPTSMEQALKSFGSAVKPNKIAILGDMLELGEYSPTAHQHILDLAQSLGLKVITVGSEFLQVSDQSLAQFENKEELINWFKKQEFKDAFFLLKGSRGIQLEALVNSLST